MCLHLCTQVTEKDSRARNLHRLTAVVTFMRVLLENFARGPEVSVKEAATNAYQQVCSFAVIAEDSLVVYSYVLLESFARGSEVSVKEAATNAYQQVCCCDC